MTTAPAVDVIILMGSDSDWESMVKCHDLLNEPKITHDVHVASAHRTPRKVHDIVDAAPARGVKVFICAAGMAAHLAGVVAAHAHCPVIGVPMPAPGSGLLDGLDALLSTVQMPPGVPVATVGMGGAGARNAAVLAAQIIGVGDPAVAARVADWKKKQTAGVEEKDAKLRASLKKQ